MTDAATRKGEAPVDADAFKDEQNKFSKYFQDKPALQP
jgi:ferredoxin